MRSLLPLLVMLLCFAGLSAAVGDFYLVPMTVVFLLTCAAALAMLRGVPFDERMRVFSRGAGRSELLLMVWIFVLAGAFAAVAKGMGSVDATVTLTLHLLPPALLPVGVFVAACLVSLSIGTSVGTIVALVPIAASMSARLGWEPALLVGAAVGGSFFGDNLSIISDTTVAATRTQGCDMRDKFRENLPLASLAAVLTVGIYIALSLTSGTATATNEVPSLEGNLGALVLRTLPYVAVLVLAVGGMNVLLVLGIGIVLCAAMGLLDGSYTLTTLLGAMKEGIGSMGELILISMMAGGLLELIRRGGGITALLWMLTRRVSSRRAAEGGLILLVMLTNICTANNTVAILSVGTLARDISRRYRIPARRAASLLDTASCVVQGVLPYGAQLLMAAGLAALSPLQIIPWLFYPFCLCLCLVLSVFLRRKR